MSCCACCRNTYSALNALAGHYNSFGPTAPIPKKRLDRLQKVRVAVAWQLQPVVGGLPVAALCLVVCLLGTGSRNSFARVALGLATSKNHSHTVPKSTKIRPCSKCCLIFSPPEVYTTLQVIAPNTLLLLLLLCYICFIPCVPQELSDAELLLSRDR